MTTGPDTLLNPLTPTRECLYSDDPRAEVVRDVFCGAEWHVRFVRDLLIFSDYLDGRPDAVMGAGETTVVLFDAAKPSSHVGSILDLGCGAGSLALLLRGSADLLVATDINPRAVDFARFNAEVNNISVEVRQGDLFQPVGDERFDLIVSQPPYYPGEEQTFLHGGTVGCELTERLLADVRSRLTAEGQAVIHTSLPLGYRTPEGALEYTPGIGEIEGTRHSLLFISARSKTQRIDVRPDQWGRLTK